MEDVEREEGDVCGLDGCGGILFYPKAENCACHINPPCSACMDVVLTCPRCGWEQEKEDYN